MLNKDAINPLIKPIKVDRKHITITAISTLFINFDAFEKTHNNIIYKNFELDEFINTLILIMRSSK